MTNSKPRHIVIDTNVIISAGLLPNSVTAKALVAAFDHYVLAQTTDTWEELVTRIQKPKLNRYFPAAHARAEYLLYINTNTSFFEAKTVATECADPTDNKFLGLAVDAGATIIVTGDAALKVLHPYRDIAIMSPADFLRAHD